MSLSHAVITGVAGFVGSHLAHTLLTAGVNVTGLDNLERGSPHRLVPLHADSRFTFVEGDIRDAKLLQSILSEDVVVFHEAALIDVNESLQHPTRYYQTNVVGFHTVLDACRHCDVPRLVFASSCAVYGHQPPGPIPESAPTTPLTPYAATKLEGERLCQTYTARYGISTIALRYFNIYGSGQTATYGGVITTFLAQARRNSVLTIYGDGCQTRDFIHISDIVTANRLAGQSKEFKHGVLNIGTGVATTITSLAETICTITGASPPTLEYAPARPGDIRFSHADITQAQQHLQFQPHYTLDTGLTQLTTALNDG
jgi:UDP-glucose 4-epimerase